LYLFLQGFFCSRHPQQFPIFGNPAFINLFSYLFLRHLWPAVMGTPRPHCLFSFCLGFWRLSFLFFFCLGILFFTLRLAAFSFFLLCYCIFSLYPWSALPFFFDHHLPLFPVFLPPYESSKVSVSESPIPSPKRGFASLLFLQLFRNSHFATFFVFFAVNTMLCEGLCRWPVLQLLF